MLACSAVFEGTTWVIALREFRKCKGDLGYFEAAVRSKDPPAFIVLFEDSAALLGLAIAFIGTLAADRLAMPVLDGVSVVTALRAMDNDVPVCVLSARSSVDDRVAGLEAGADDYLVKPFQLTELVARIKALLRRRGATAQRNRRRGTDATMTDLTMTDRAARRIGEILKTEPSGAMLRLSVLGGGCSGFQYKFDVEKTKADDDAAIVRDGVTMLVDSVSLQYLTGSEVDFVEDLIGASFKVNNPQAKASCGCGTSFSV